MIDDLLDGLASSVGFGRSIVARRGQRLSPSGQVLAYVLGVVFFAVAACLLFMCFGAQLQQTLVWWVLFPLGLLLLYLLFEVGLWVGIVLAELGFKSRQD